MQQEKLALSTKSGTQETFEDDVLINEKVTMQ